MRMPTDAHVSKQQNEAEAIEVRVKRRGKRYNMVRLPTPVTKTRG